MIADIGAAFLLVAGGAAPINRLLLILLAGIALYWAGMILNDVFDIDRDRLERPTRPIAAGQISQRVANRAGWSLLILGVVLATISGRLPGVTASWLPALVATGLAIMIVAYDGPLKSTPLAPIAMGTCRALSFLLGASAASVVGDGPVIPDYVFGISLGFGVYIMGLTTMARHEASGGHRALLAIGLITTICGLGLLALSPHVLASSGGPAGPQDWHTDTQRTFPLMIGLIGLPVIVRASRAVAVPTPRNIQTTIGVGILSIIPLAASLAFLGAGLAWGLAIIALVVPSIALAGRFRVT